MGYGGDVAEQKNKHMNLLDNIQIQVEEIKKFKELNDIQKSRKLKHIRTLGKMTKEEKDKRKRVKKKNKKPKVRETVRSYKSYIVSKLWKKRKNEYYKKHGKQCSCCKSTRFVQLHHKVYTGIYGNEPDHHLIAMCGNCHKLFHDTYGVKGNMKEETGEFVKEMNESIHLKKEMELLDNFIKSL